MRWRSIPPSRLGFSLETLGQATPENAIDDRFGDSIDQPYSRTLGNRYLDLSSQIQCTIALSKSTIEICEATDVIDRAIVRPLPAPSCDCSVPDYTSRLAAAAMPKLSTVLVQLVERQTERIDIMCVGANKFPE